ncbi:MAG: hypothetical protein AAB350_01765 [Patescibacteria group bacterium]
MEGVQGESIEESGGYKLWRQSDSCIARFFLSGDKNNPPELEDELFEEIVRKGPDEYALSVRACSLGELKENPPNDLVIDWKYAKDYNLYFDEKNCRWIYWIEGNITNPDHDLIQQGIEKRRQKGITHSAFRFFLKNPKKYIDNFTTKNSYCPFTNKEIGFIEKAREYSRHGEYESEDGGVRHDYESLKCPCGCGKSAEEIINE